MGRGRKKAKATKIARELKYTDPGTDLARLQAELQSTRPTPKTPEQVAAQDGDAEDDEE